MLPYPSYSITELFDHKRNGVKPSDCRNFGGNNGNMNPGLNMNPGMMMNQGMVPAPTMNMNPVLGNQGPNMGNQGNNMGGLGPMFNQPSNSMW